MWAITTTRMERNCNCFCHGGHNRIASKMTGGEAGDRPPCVHIEGCAFLVRRHPWSGRHGWHARYYDREGGRNTRTSFDTQWATIKRADGAQELPLTPEPQHTDHTHSGKSATVDGRKFATTSTWQLCAHDAIRNVCATHVSKPLAPNFNVGA